MLDHRRDAFEGHRRVARHGARGEVAAAGEERGAQTLRRIQRRLDDPRGVARQVPQAHDVVAVRAEARQRGRERRVGGQQPAFDRARRDDADEGLRDREQSVVVVDAGDARRRSRRTRRAPRCRRRSRCRAPRSAAGRTATWRRAQSNAAAYPLMRAARTGAERGCARRDRGGPRASRSPARVARAWISTLPSAVASTGPASTGRPERSAVRWQSSSFSDAAADDVDRAHVDAADAAGLVRGIGEGLRERLDDAARVLGACARRGDAVLACTTRRCGSACRRAEGTAGRSRRRPEPGR